MSRAIDALVAENVMGYTWGTPDGRKDNYMLLLKGEEIDIPEYSTDISAAWEVINSLKFIAVSVVQTEYNCYCEIKTKAGEFEVKDVTIARAICLAALKVKGVSLEGDLRPD